MMLNYVPGDLVAAIHYDDDRITLVPGVVRRIIVEQDGGATVIRVTVESVVGEGVTVDAGDILNRNTAGNFSGYQLGDVVARLNGMVATRPSPSLADPAPAPAPPPMALPHIGPVEF